MKQIIFLLLFFISIQLHAQQHILSGTVKDRAGIAIPGAGIYISGSKTATVTDADGKFRFTTLPVGNYDVLVQMIGFQPANASVQLLDKNVNINLVLDESMTNIKQVEIRPDANLAYYQDLFKKHFIGKTANSAFCKITNMEVLRFDFDRQDGTLKATATDFLIIENQALGYRIKYLLKNFEHNQRSGIVYYEGYPTFEEMPGGNARQRRWERERQAAYLGSSQHFFRALATGTTKEDGFIIHKMRTIHNENRPPDEVIQPNITRLMKGNAGLRNVLTFNGNDSLSYWMRMKAQPKTLNVLDRNIVNPDTLTHTYNADIKYINFTDELYILYTKEKEAEGIFNSGYRLTRPPDIGNVQISQIRALKLPIAFYMNGNTADPTASLSSGYFAYEKIADQVPMEYEVKGKK